ncbi:MAG TPA: DUF3224 domain-containing protein [Actinomycetota bacterium]|jgi:hypothetical protein
MRTATGTFEITDMSEETYAELESGVRLTRAGGTQRFAGDLEGEGSVEWVMCYLPDGTASYEGLQLVTATLNGLRGGLVMRSTGHHDGSQSRGEWTVIEGSGTGELAGVTGKGTFTASGGPSGSYTLDFDGGSSPAA